MTIENGYGQAALRRTIGLARPALKSERARAEARRTTCFGNEDRFRHADLRVAS